MAARSGVFRCFRCASLRRVPIMKSSCRSVANQAEEKDVYFGYERVSEEEKTKRVYKVFENVASSYDVMNDVMSVGIHRFWKDRLIKVLNPRPGTKLLDVAGGTGDIAFRVLNHMKGRSSRRPEPEDVNTHVTVCDISKAMLDVGQHRAQRYHYSTANISWVVGDAEELPMADESFDAYTIAFGIRNITRINKALSEAYRVLAPGGRFLCLEFSQLQNQFIARAYDKYSFDVIPVMGQIIANDWKSYQYLVESIRQFPDQEKFASMIEDAGFSNITFENLSFGIAAIHSGFKL